SHSVRLDTVDVHPSCDVLQLTLAHILKDHLDFPDGIFMDALRHANGAWFGQCLEARRDINAIAKDITVLNDDVALVEADAKLNTPILSFAQIALGNRALNLEGATQRRHRARELDQNAVTHELDDAALVLGDLGVDQLRAMRLEAP